MVSITPIATSKVSLSGFVSLYGREDVSRVDAQQRLSELAKVTELTGFAESTLQHFHIAFAFALPPQIVFELQNLGVGLSFSSEFGFPTVNGLMSGSYLTWLTLFRNSKNLEKPTQQVLKALYDSQFRLLPYFQDVKWI